jgi:hypothetical protein
MEQLVAQAVSGTEAARAQATAALLTALKRRELNVLGLVRDSTDEDLQRRLVPRDCWMIMLLGGCWHCTAAAAAAAVAAAALMRLLRACR